MKFLENLPKRNFIFGILTASLTLVAIVGFYTWDVNQKQTASEFIADAEKRYFVIEETLFTHIQVIQQISSFYHASESVSREKFSIFVESHLQNYPSIQALEWIPRVSREERNSFERRAQREGLKGFQFTERKAQGEMVSAEEREEYFPVYYVEPFEGNRAAVGFDLASNPARLKALNESRETGNTVATARITLVQEEGSQAGFLVFSPVYDSGTRQTPDRVNRSPKGFALGVFRVGDLVENSVENLDLHDSGIDIYLYDDTDAENWEFLHFYSATESGADPKDRTQIQSNLNLTRTFQIAGREWTVVAVPTEVYLTERASALPLVAILVGLFITLVLVKYFVNTFSHTEEVDRLIVDLSKENESRIDTEKELKRHQENLEELVSERTRALEEQNERLESFRRVTIGRELKMIELKKKINELLRELGRPKEYEETEIEESD